MGERTKRRADSMMRRDRRALKWKPYPGERKRYPRPSAWLRQQKEAKGAG